LAKLTREHQIRRLVLAGISPTEAARAVDRAAEHGYSDDLAELSPEVQEERARVWWEYQTAVRPSLRQLLDARLIEEGETIA